MEAAESSRRAWAQFARRRNDRSRFQDGAAAGRELAERLLGFTQREDCMVLALPRGGVPVAGEIARRLGLPLDVLLAQPLGVPGHAEQAFGAVAAEGSPFLDHSLIRAAQVSPGQIASAIDSTRAALKAQARVLRKGRAPLDLEGKVVILVGDGAISGACLFAGVHVLQRMRPAQVVVAAPVLPEAACVLLEREVDLLLALKRPSGFYKLTQFYEELPALSDDDVLRVLYACGHGPKKRAHGTPRAEAHRREA